jgi:hypothetical protein
MVNFQTYHISKPFFFQTPNPIPQYRHQSMRALYVLSELPDLAISKYDLGSLLRLRVNAYSAFYVWPFSLLIAAGIFAMWRSQLRVVLFSLALVAAGLLAQGWKPQPHYAAPAAGAVFLATLYSLQHFRNSQSAYTIWGSRAVVIVFAVWMISPIAERLRDPFKISAMLPGAEATRMGAIPMPSEVQRGRIQSMLEARRGKQLIIVHYPFFSAPVQDWIYNDADMDHARVIWARDMGDLQNRELLNYYADRQVWYVDRADPCAVVWPYKLAAAAPQLAGEPQSSAALSPRARL